MAEVLWNARSPSVALNYSTQLLKRVPNVENPRASPLADPEALQSSAPGTPPFPFGALTPNLAAVALSTVARTAQSATEERHSRTAHSARERTVRATLEDERFWLLCHALNRGRGHLSDQDLSRVLWSLQRLLPGYGHVFRSEAVSKLNAENDQNLLHQPSDTEEDSTDGIEEVGDNVVDGGRDEDGKADMAPGRAPIMRHAAAYSLALGIAEELHERIDRLKGNALCSSTSAFGALGLGPHWNAPSEVQGTCASHSRFHFPSHSLRVRWSRNADTLAPHIENL